MRKEFPEKNIYLEDDSSEREFRLKAEMLFQHQLKNWALASDNYRSLDLVQVRQFEFDHFTIDAHYNSGRIISSSAKVDEKTVKSRPCFLCTSNLPDEQKAVRMVNQYILLVNPFPIFEKHFTIPSTGHVPQAIKSEVANLLTVSSLLGAGYSVFYNGPACGASAPDHLHFQAGNSDFMKINGEFGEIKNHYGKILFEDDELILAAVNSPLRNFLTIESASKNKIASEFIRIYTALTQKHTDAEPMMNIICSYDNGWRLLIFPRSRHRPLCFFEEGENGILISPAAVDMGGVLIFPREKDFYKITKELITDIFRQVTLSDAEFAVLTDKLKHA